MNEPICDHGSQKRKCVICENNEILDVITAAIKILNDIDEKQCSIKTWDAVVDVINMLEEA